MIEGNFRIVYGYGYSDAGWYKLKTPNLNSRNGILAFGCRRPLV
jgi:hypothetical protein